MPLALYLCCNFLESLLLRQILCSLPRWRSGDSQNAGLNLCAMAMTADPLALSPSGALYAAFTTSASGKSAVGRRSRSPPLWSAGPAGRCAARPVLLPVLGPRPAGRPGANSASGSCLLCAPPSLFRAIIRSCQFS